jgi:hypothetical protein
MSTPSCDDDDDDNDGDTFRLVNPAANPVMVRDMV